MAGENRRGTYVARRRVGTDFAKFGKTLGFYKDAFFRTRGTLRPRKFLGRRGEMQLPGLGREQEKQKSKMHTT